MHNIDLKKKYAVPVLTELGSILETTATRAGGDLFSMAGGMSVDMCDPEDFGMPLYEEDYAGCHILERRSRRDG